MEWGASTGFFASPAGMAVLALVSLFVTALFLYACAGAVYWVSRRLLPRLRWVWSKLVPEGPAGVLAVTFLFATAIVFGFAAPIPSSIGSLGDDADGGAASMTGGFLDQAFENGEIIQAEDGVVYVETGGYDRPEPDTAGDRLRDDWLREGETAEGAPLEEGSVGRLDLYVYVVHGSNVDPLTDREKRQLREVWARMPVENPDGSTGVDIHVEEGPRLDEEVHFEDGSDSSRYYASAVPDSRHCRYQLVVLGEPTTKTAGVAFSPGYSSFVTGVRDSRYEGNVTNTVAVATHELLHNVAGRMDGPGLPDGGGHTHEGWLTPEVDGQEFLSPTTAAHLNESRFSGSGLYQNEICSSGG